MVILSIAASAGVVFYESFMKLLDPQPMRRLGWVAAAALAGFLGNEAVALLQIRAGKRIGSAALIADGQHARTDGFPRWPCCLPREARGSGTRSSTR